MPSQRLFAQVHLTVDATGTVEEVTSFHGFHLLNGNCNGSQLVSSFSLLKTSGNTDPVLFSSVPSLSFSVSSQPVMFSFFQALCRTFFPPPAPVSQQFPAPTPVPRLGRSHVRKGASDTSISSAQGHQSQQHFQGHDERIKRTKMSSYCEPQYKLQRKKLLESVRWMVLVYITADLL